MTTVKILVRNKQSGNNFRARVKSTLVSKSTAYASPQVRRLLYCGFHTSKLVLVPKTG